MRPGFDALDFPFPHHQFQGYYVRHWPTGQKLWQLSESDRQLCESMETTLRLALLRAIEDDVFAAMLTNADEIKKHWQI